MTHSVARRSFRAILWAHVRDRFPADLWAFGLWFLLVAGVVFITAEEQLGRQRARLVACAAGAAFVSAVCGILLAAWWFAARRYRMELDGDILTVAAPARARFHLRYVEAVRFGLLPTNFRRGVFAAAKLGVGHTGVLAAALEAHARGAMVVVEKTGRVTEFADVTRVFDPQSLSTFLEVLRERGVEVGTAAGSPVADEPAPVSPSSSLH